MGGREAVSGGRAGGGWAGQEELGGSPAGKGAQASLIRDLSHLNSRVQGKSLETPVPARVKPLSHSRVQSALGQWVPQSVHIQHLAGMMGEKDPLCCISFMPEQFLLDAYPCKDTGPSTPCQDPLGCPGVR